MLLISGDLHLTYYHMEQFNDYCLQQIFENDLKVTC